MLLIAVMAAIAVVGRMAFFMLPQFKPVTAIVIITGISLGAEAGFLTGAVAGFVSNFFFGQGPWTPWQMFAFGIIGFLAGLLFRGKREKYKKSKLILCLYGGNCDTCNLWLFDGYVFHYYVWHRIFVEGACGNVCKWSAV